MKAFIAKIFRPWQLALLLAGAVAAAGLGGCFAVVVGAGAAGTAVAYVRGELTGSLGYDFDRVYKVADKALIQLEFAKTSGKKDALEAVLEARTARDTKVTIELRKTGANLTEVKIRVGVFGDEQFAMMILDKIKSNL